MKNFSNALIDTLTARASAAPSNDLTTSINNAKTHAKALDTLFGQKEFAPVAKKLLSSLAIVSASDNRDEFIAVKVVVKIVNTARALATNQVRGVIDPYTQNILENLANLRDEGLHNKSCMVGLSKSIEWVEEDQKQKLKARYGCSVGTAGTQTSSTRMMLRALDVCEVLKGKRGDTIMIKNNERSEMLFNLIKGEGKALVATEPKKSPAERFADKQANASKSEKTETAPVEKKEPAKRPSRAKKTETKVEAAPVEAKPAEKKPRASRAKKTATAQEEMSV